MFWCPMIKFSCFCGICRCCLAADAWWFLLLILVWSETKPGILVGICDVNILVACSIFHGHQKVKHGMCWFLFWHSRILNFILVYSSFILHGYHENFESESKTLKDPWKENSVQVIAFLSYSISSALNETLHMFF